MAFVLQLSFTSSGKDYSTSNLTEDQLACLQHLREFGLIFQRKRKSKRFYPTKLGRFRRLSIAVKEDVSVCQIGRFVAWSSNLSRDVCRAYDLGFRGSCSNKIVCFFSAIDLTSAAGPGDSGLPLSSSSSSSSSSATSSARPKSSALGGSAGDKGFIVVETNYHVYAYTESTLKIALLALFSDMLYRFPNMCVGTCVQLGPQKKQTKIQNARRLNSLAPLPLQPKRQIEKIEE